MSFSDYLIVTGAANTSSDLRGEAVFNSSLSPPVITSSLQCRKFQLPDLTATHANYFVSSSFNGGSHVNIPDTKSVSLRMWVRGNNTNYTMWNGASLLAKHSVENNALLGNANSNRPLSGYEFGYKSRIYDSENGFLYYEFGGYRANIPTNVDQRRRVEQVGIDKWIGLRMDIIPVKAIQIINGVPTNSLLKDVINLYTASLSNPDNWIQVYNTEILTTDDRFVPWGNYTVYPSTQGGYGSPPEPQVLTSSYGFTVAANVFGYDSRLYIDDFKMYVQNAF